MALRGIRTAAARLTAKPARLTAQIVGDPDPVALGRALVDAGIDSMSHPRSLFDVWSRWVWANAAITGSVISRGLGEPVAPVFEVDPRDKRFQHDWWETNPLFFWIQQAYLAASELVDGVVEIAIEDDPDAVKTRLAASLLKDSMAPTNGLLTNPAAVERAMATGGRSVLCGVQNMVRDMRSNQGFPSQVDASPFAVGRNMALTPGAVVYRNDLIEVIQYEAQTDEVHEVPLLFCPPWINKYYIMDLAPDRSLIEWAVQHGHTSFAISYRNPDESMRDTTFEDYLRDGVLDALDVVSEITGAPRVNTVSVCLGGTLTAIAMAHGAAIGDEKVNTATFLNTHTDFTRPGVLGAFTDPETVAKLSKRMEKKGYLEASDMAHTFDLIRANDLVFQYVVNNWLLGEQPPAFDLLAWNADSTRMPAKMHSSYLKRCYVDNEFSEGRFEVDGQRLDPSAVSQDTFVLCAIDDHIVPWQSGHKTAQLLGGDNQFVLSNAGHIAGIVNPPNPKARYWTNADVGEDPQHWLDAAELHEGTWWDEWARWIADRAGPMVPAPSSLGSDLKPVIEPAPGKYVNA